MATQVKIQDRLAFRLARYTVLLAFAIGLVLSSLQVFEDYREQDSLIDETVNQILVASKPAASRAVHTLDHALAEEVVSGLLKYSFIQSALIKDELGEVLAQGERGVEKTPTQWLTDTIGAQQKTYNWALQAPEYANIPPGELQLVVNLDQALQPFFDRSLTVIFSGIARNILLALMLILLFYSVLTRPLERLAQQFAELRPGAAGNQKLVIKSSDENNEFGQLCNAGNQFLHTVEHLLEENQQSALNLSESENRLHKLIDSVPQLIWALNVRGEVLFCNRQFAAFYANEPDHLKGCNINELQLHAPQQVEELTLLSAACQQGGDKTEIFDFSWTLPAGKEHFFSLQLSAFEYFSEPATLVVANDISEQKMIQEHISYLANHDSLTELPNRTLLNDKLAHALASCRRNNTYNALLFLDLDHFKTTNDSLGHKVGDQLLINVANILRTQVKGIDTVARLGGDEFVVLLQSGGDSREQVEKEAAQICESILAQLSQPMQIGKHQLRITGSIGVVVFPILDKSVEDLMRYADTAMYRAKDQGRKGYVFFHEDMSLAVEKRQDLENQLHDALELEQFELFYQPQVDKTGQIHAFEALIRWRHPERGLVSPGEFIPSLEGSGLIVPVSEWIIRECCQQIRTWRAEDFWQEGWYISLNISPLQFYQVDFIPHLQYAAGQSGIELSDLCVEVTETVAIENVDFAASRLEKLRSLGVSVSLDDFGTGYSSLSYLKALPINIVKIDRSFVIDMDHKNQSIIRAVADIAEAFELHIVAEGVETEEQLAMADKTGCDLFQGFYFARPAPAAEVQAQYQQELEKV